jgi:prepilin-type N-terminal cleavage/methylation domain-containing protein
MIMNTTPETKHKGGFTLLELLIVISIIAILSVALVFILNPAETLKKSRDAQRISDLSTLKSSLGLYLTSTTTPYLGGIASNAACKDTAAAWGNAADKIFYSYSGANAAITDATLDGGSGSIPDALSTTTPALTDGTGWIPVNFETLTSGSPISNLPLDPVNTITDVAAVASTDLVYRYACRANNLTFEINAQLESEAYTVSDDKRTKDGGNNDNYYETGTNLKIFGTGTDF